MSAGALPVFERLSAHLLTGADRSSDPWSSPSACAGWSNTDVLVHLACTLRELGAPESLPTPVLGDIEATNEVQVAAFPAATPADAFTHYAEQLPAALTALQQLQAPELGHETFSLQNAGVHPVHLAAESLVFDHYCHLQHDLTVGPAVLADLSGDVSVEALHWSVRWLAVGLPQMSPPGLAEVLVEPLVLQLTGPGGGVWTLHPADAGEVVLVSEGAGAATTVSCPADDFVRWGTKRTQWREAEVVVRGDAVFAHRVLDAIHVF